MTKVQGDTIVAKQYDFGVRVITRTPGTENPEAGFFGKSDVMAYLDAQVKAGWRLMGEPQFTGMEKFNLDPDAGFRVMFWWERGD